MSRTVTLRNTRDEDGLRHLSATLKDDGDLVIEGQDLGDGVERFFGSGIREYEWTCTVRASDVPKLADALSAKDNLLSALEATFNDDKVGDVESFLDEQNIPYAFWSRLGD